MDEQKNPLEFWVAYLPDGKKRKYMSDGKGHLRMFKSKRAIIEWLDANMRRKERQDVIVHSLQGNISIPVDPSTEEKVTNSVNTPTLISTLVPATTPTSKELLDGLMIRRKMRKRK